MEEESECSDVMSAGKVQESQIFKLLLEALETKINLKNDECIVAFYKQNEMIIQSKLALVLSQEDQDKEEEEQDGQKEGYISEEEESRKDDIDETNPLKKIAHLLTDVLDDFEFESDLVEKAYRLFLKVNIDDPSKQSSNGSKESQITKMIQQRIVEMMTNSSMIPSAQSMMSVASAKNNQVKRRGTTLSASMKGLPD